MTTNTTALGERADIAYQEQVADQWRDWCRYLRAQLQLLSAREAQRTRQATFERSGDGGDQRSASAEADLLRISPARRTIFDAEREARRQALQAAYEQEQRGDGERGRVADPDAIDREALTQLLAEATGTTSDDPDERGFVPMGEDRWYSVNVQVLEGIPAAAAYTLQRTDRDDRRKRLLLAGALLLFGVGFAALWLLWPRSAAPTRRTDAIATINGDAVRPWPITQLVLEQANGEQATLPIMATTSANWPTTDGPYLRTGMLWPLQLCLPQQELATVRAVELVGSDAVPRRRYTIQPAASGAVADLVLAACSSEEGGATAFTGTLVEMPAAAVEPFNQPVALDPKTTLTVRTIKVGGRGEEPTLPEGQVRISVSVSTTASLAWPSLNPTLLLATDAKLLPSETAVVSGGALLHYLVPAFDAPLDVAWQLDTAAGQRRWRTTLAPPSARLDVLRAALAIEDATATRDAESNQLTLALVLTNRGRSPLQLSAADIVVTSGGAPLSTPDILALRAPLAPGEQRPVQLALPSAGNGQPVVVTVGVERFRVR